MHDTRDALVDLGAKDDESRTSGARERRASSTTAALGWTHLQIRKPETMRCRGQAGPARIGLPNCRRSFWPVSGRAVWGGTKERDRVLRTPALAESAGMRTLREGGAGDLLQPPPSVQGPRNTPDPDVSAHRHTPAGSPTLYYRAIYVDARYARGVMQIYSHAGSFFRVQEFLLTKRCRPIRAAMLLAQRGALRFHTTPAMYKS